MLGLLTHRRVAGLLSSYIDGQVTSAERRLIEGHLPGCDRCSKELDELRRTVSLMGTLPELTPGRSYVLSSAHRPAPARRSALPLWAPGIAAAACAVLLAVVISGQAVGVLVQSGDFGQESESFAAEPPALDAPETMALDDSTVESSLVAETAQTEAPSAGPEDFQQSEEAELMEAAVSYFEADIELEAMEAADIAEVDDATSQAPQADVAATEPEAFQMEMTADDAAEAPEEAQEEAAKGMLEAREDDAADLPETREDPAAPVDPVTEDPAGPDPEPLALPLWQIQLGAGVALVAFAVAALAIWLVRLRRP